MNLKKNVMIKDTKDMTATTLTVTMHWATLGMTFGELIVRKNVELAKFLVLLVSIWYYLMSGNISIVNFYSSFSQC